MTTQTKEKPLTKKQEKERDQQNALNTLRQIIKPGDTIYAKIVHRSKSNMYAVVQLFIPLLEREGPRPQLKIMDITGLAADAAGDRWDDKHYGIGLSGCGYSKTFEAVYGLGRALFKDGFTCAGKVENAHGRYWSCPSNDHNNGDKNYGPHYHTDPGYALREERL